MPYSWHSVICRVEEPIFGNTKNMTRHNGHKAELRFHRSGRCVFFVNVVLLVLSLPLHLKLEFSNTKNTTKHEEHKVKSRFYRSGRCGFFVDVVLPSEFSETEVVTNK